MIRRTLCLALLGLAAPAATVGAPVGGAPDTFAARITNKLTDQFAACFVRSQDLASRSWSFVPKENGGGTFSNLGATGVSSPYYLDVADRGSRREIRLEAAGASTADAAVLRAVDSCI